MQLIVGLLDADKLRLGEGEDAYVMNFYFGTALLLVGVALLSRFYLPSKIGLTFGNSFMRYGIGLNLIFCYLFMIAAVAVVAAYVFQRTHRR
ncbi:MAG TPA: hypothetical protein VJS43_07005 [Candidatus Acidoferrales bacterium]|nr:hypothetical protein [Candidatus Acidoferrales bacterium]